MLLRTPRVYGNEPGSPKSFSYATGAVFLGLKSFGSSISEEVINSLRRCSAIGNPDYHNRVFFHDLGTAFATSNSCMEADETTKKAVQQLVNAIQNSVDTNEGVRSAVETLEFMGYIPNFTVRMDLELLRPVMDGLTDTKVRIA